MHLKNNIYTISAGRPFLKVLADGLLRQYGNGGVLSKVLVLLPNKRSCIELRQAFLWQNQNAMILPNIKAIGDTDETSLAVSGDDTAEKLLKIPPAISRQKRALLLAELIYEYQDNKSKEKALNLAITLASFLDEVQKEQISFDNLASLVPEELAEHWQVTIDFFSVVAEKWPRKLRELGVIDPIDRRNKLTEIQADIWSSKPPPYPIVAAGTTGSVPSTRKLINMICGLPEGCLILPGLDIIMDNNSWNQVKEIHPQYGIKSLLSELKIGREEIKEWNPPASRESRISYREKFVSDIMLPPEYVEKWAETKVENEAVNGITRIETENLREEAGVISLILREQLEKPGKTAALVTNDRKLARMVASNLQKWDIEIDDSAGSALNKTSAVMFMQLVTEMVTSDFAPVEMLAALKHPFASCGKNTAIFRNMVRELEMAVLRGVRIGGGLNSISDSINNTDLRHLLQEIKNSVSDLSNILAHKTIDLQMVLKIHLSAAENLARTDSEKGYKILWKHDQGEQAFEYIQELMESSAGFTIAEPWKHYARIFDTILSYGVYRPRYKLHPRLAILSPIEARLLDFDLTILAGMNEGSWPASVSTEWMNRAMRQKFGLPAVEKMIGLSAHDFASMLCMPEVVITRSIRVDGAPAIQSPWLMRIDAVLESSGLSNKLKPAKPWQEWARMLNKADKKEKIFPPEPRPPISVRPKKLSVTQIGTLMTDPYSIYARHILGLKKLDEIDEQPDLSEFGNMVHSALDLFIKKYNNAELGNLLLCGRSIFEIVRNRPALYATWWPRFESIAEWFIKKHEIRLANLKNIFTEKNGAMILEINGKEFTLTAKADRIEVTKDGKVTIIDYKTGTVPQWNEVRKGTTPQLPLEALIATAGGFHDIQPSSEINDLIYWKLSGKLGQSKESSLISQKKLQINEIVNECKEGVQKLIELFYDEGTPYISLPYADDLEKATRYNDYIHLARAKEWL